MKIKQIEKQIMFLTRILEQNQNYVEKGLNHPYYSTDDITRMEAELINLREEYEEIENSL